jgi:outer membrane biosynthesis protein TonB
VAEKPKPQPKPEPKRDELADIQKALRDVRKPEPQRPPAKEPPKPAPPKKDDFADLAKTVKDLAPSAAAPQRQSTASARPSSTRFAGELTMSEEDALRRQIERCWNVPAGARDGQDLIVEVRVSLNQDGSVRDVRAAPSPRMSDPFYRAAAESAVRAVQRCSPLNVPPDKYSSWKEMTLTFNPKDLLG